MMHVNKYFLIGGILGVLSCIAIYSIHTYSDCLSCGFMGIDYCDYEQGMCQVFSTFQNVVMVISIPLIILGAFVYWLFLENAQYVMSPPVWLLFVLVFVLYFALCGYVISKFFRK